MFGVNLDPATAGLLDEIAERFGTSRTQSIRLAVRTAHTQLMTVKLPFSFEERQE